MVAYTQGAKGSECVNAEINGPAPDNALTDGISVSKARMSMHVAR